MALLHFGEQITRHMTAVYSKANKVRSKNVTAQVLRDRVILTGQDRIPHEITFHSTLLNRRRALRNSERGLTLVELIIGCRDYRHITRLRFSLLRLF